MQLNSVDILGGDAILGHRVASNSDMIALLREGIPVGSVDNIVKAGYITMSEIDAVIIPRKTLENRRRIGTLTTEQSDRLHRAARVIAKALNTFGSKDKTNLWLRRPTAALGGVTPISLLDTNAGAEQVMNLLARIDHGIAA